MASRDTVEKIREKIKKNIENYTVYEDMHDYLENLCEFGSDRDEHPDFWYAHEINHESVVMAAEQLRYAKDMTERKRWYEIYRKLLKYDAEWFFDSYLLYMELDREPGKRFYQPRRHYLRPYVAAYQEILSGKLDFLSCSMVKRAGKSQLGINFTCMLSGIRPDNATLMEGAGDDLVKSFYKGCLEYVQDDSEYLFRDVFPIATLTETNADLKTLNLHNTKRFPTIMCRSIDARQVGLSEATNLLYLDDTVEGRKEAKNRARLDEKWEIISGDIIGRAIEGTPIVSCGTRYSLYDPMGRLIDEMRKQGMRMKVIEIPALDPVTDKSNFEYIRRGKPVFTTQYFRNQRKMLSEEQFESEFQQKPFEAKGIMFPAKRLNRFMELPIDRDPDTIIAVCDTAEKGDDFCSMPIVALYGADAYVIDVVYDDSAPDITKPECAKALIKNNVTAATFESNGAGEYFGRDVGKILSENNYPCNIKMKRTITNKHTRIEMASDGVIRNFYFLDESLYEPFSQYGQFMRNLTTYTRSGKVPHDDAPDSISLMENEIRNLSQGKVEVFKRMF